MLFLGKHQPVMGVPKLRTITLKKERRNRTNGLQLLQKKSVRHLTLLKAFLKVSNMNSVSNVKILVERVTGVRFQNQSFQNQIQLSVPHSSRKN